MKPTTNNIDIQRCVQQAGDNKFDLILIAAARARELARGSRSYIIGSHKNTVLALEEIQEGHVGRELLRKVGSKKR